MSQTKLISGFKKLSAVEHVLKRPGRYLGSIQSSEKPTWVLNNGKAEKLTAMVNDGFLKLFDEIISNSVDHSMKPEGKNLTTIRVSVSGDEIKVSDNGGIPVLVHPEYDQLIPDMIFGELRSGSNFDDDSSVDVTGQNGEGASLVNIFSTAFTVETSDGSNAVTIKYSKNMSEKEISSITPSSHSDTTISYKPDLERFGMREVGEFEKQMIYRRCVEVAALSPHLTVFFNDQKIEQNDFKSFCGLFDGDFIIFSSDKWKVAVSYSNTQTQISYVNRTQTHDGGTHLDLVMDRIVDIIRPTIEKRTKTDVSPSDIRSRLFVVIAAEIPLPRYSSQTKEKLITPAGAYRSTLKFDQAFSDALLKSEMLKMLIDWVSLKKRQDDLEKASKHLNALKREGVDNIPKYFPATSKNRENCTLFICEGDSAVKPLFSARDPVVQGLFALQGKPENCFGKSASRMLTKEITNLMAATGLSIGMKDFSGIRYKRIVFTTDADLDGIHIRGILMQLFRQFWPGLLREGRIYILKTPVFICTVGGKVYELYDDLEYEDFIKENPRAKVKYYKGLGTHDTSSFKRFISSDQYMVQVKYGTEGDDEALNIAFDPDRADDRKLWVSQGV